VIRKFTLKNIRKQKNYTESGGVDSQRGGGARGGGVFTSSKGVVKNISACKYGAVSSEQRVAVIAPW